MRRHLVLTASGTDRPGVLEEFTKVLLHFDANVETSRVARLGGAFAMLMMVSAPEEKLEVLQEAVAQLGIAKYDVISRLTEVTEHEEGSSDTSLGITVAGADHIGIIHQISSYLAEQGINVENMSTEVVAAPMSGSPLFTMSAMLRVPNKLTVDDVKEALEFIGDEVGVVSKTYTHVD
jgi:glycine cleavage system transcriptional repressor